jgi:hypothetical protein
MKILVGVIEQRTLGTDMNPDGYPAASHTERGVFSTVDPRELSVQNIDQFHPGVPFCGAGNGWLLVLFPILPKVAMVIKALRYRH